MNYLSVCSGIEAASVAWHPLGRNPVAFSQFDPAHNYAKSPDFPSAVLAHHYPSVPNLGDMTRFKEWPDADVDVLVGGTPCQSFSVAGLRKGMADPRGNLALTYLAIADQYRPEWLVWENVPGVLSSNDGRDFGAFLGALVELGYGFAYRILDAQYVRVDGLGRAVPQRRRRVFVVGHPDWRRAAAVLFERESLCWDFAPRREAREGVAPTLSARTKGGGGLGTDFDLDGGLVAKTLLSGGHANNPLDENLIPFDTTQITSKANRSHPKPGDPCHPLASTHPPAIARPVADTLTAYWERSKGAKAGNQVGLINPILEPYTLAIRGRDGAPDLEYRQDGTANAILTPNGGRAGIGVGAIAWSIMPQNSGRDYKARAVDVAQPLMAGGPVGGNQGGDYVQNGWAVRRLTPMECERLQGFPDGYTDVRYRDKPASDGARYKALGNSMAVNVMRWIGRRIDLVRAIPANDNAEAARHAA